MRFKSISFKNFISYRDEQTIDFFPKKNGLIILEGEMGHGKSNFLNAFYWCLFDDLWHSDEAKFINNPNPTDVDLFNYGVLEDAIKDSEDYIELFVEIEFMYEDDLFKVRREHGATFIVDQWEFDNRSKLLVTQKKGNTGETQSYDDEQATGIIQKYFPKNISNYFLFRGENRTELAKLTGKSTFSNALSELSKLKLFERMVDHLEFAYKKARKQAAAAQGGDIESELEKNRKKEETCEEALKAFINAETELIGDFQDAESKYDEYTEKIKTNAHALENQQKIERIEGEISGLSDRLKDMEERKKKNIATDWSTILVKGLPGLIGKRYKKGIKSGDFPKPIKMSIYEETIKNCKCSLCQADLESKTIDKLKKLIQDQKNYDIITSEIERLAGDSEKIIQFVGSLPEKMKSTDEIINGFEEEIKDKNLFIDGMREKIGNLSDDMGTLTAKQSEARDDQLQIQQRLSNIRERIVEQQTHRDQIKGKIASLLEQLDKGTLETIRLTIAEDAFNAGIKLDKMYRNDLFDKLQKFTQENWEKLCYDILNYETILLDRDNSYFDVLDTNGNTRRGSMNSGHRIILVLSFISGLIRIAKENFGEEIPMVLDAPVSEIGRSARPKLLSGWGSIFGQSILILQDNTITPDIKFKIGNDLVKMYSLKYDKNKQSTIVTEA